MFSLTEVPPQSEKELWLASLTEAPLNPKKNFGSLRSPKSPSIRRRTLARFAHRSYFFFGATCYTMTTDYSLEKELWLASLTEVISSSEQPPSPSDDLRVLA